MAAPSEKSLANLKPFEPGQGGRPKGARNRLGEAFVEALEADFNKHGSAAIVQVRAEKPDQYLKVIASILPKELKVTRESDLSDDELIERIRQLDEFIRPFLGAEGVSEGGRGASEAPAAASRKGLTH